MKAPNKMIAFAGFLFVVVAGASVASAQVPGPPKDPATSAGATCELKEFEECKAGLATCREDYNTYVLWSMAQCPSFSGIAIEKLKDYARTGTDVPKRPKTPKHPKRPKKPTGDKPQAPKVTKVTVEVLVPLYGDSEPVAPNGACPNGSFKLPVGFDKDGDKVLDADEVVERLQSGCNGKDGANGKPGKPGRNGAHSYTTKTTRFTSDPACPAGGVRSTNWTDLNGNGVLDKGEAQGDVVLCDGKAGSAGRPGANGDTRVQFGFGLRASGIWSKDRPIGISAAPEAQLELWLAPTVEFVAGVAWAPDGDRNMVVTGQLRHRALNKRLGLGFGVQYQAWNLEGNKALWQSVMGMGSVQVVLVDSKWVDISVDAGLLLGLDGYDAAAQFAVGATGGFTASLKF